MMSDVKEDYYTTDDRVEAYGKIVRFLEKGEDQITECYDHAYATIIAKLWNDRIDYEQ